MVLTAMTVLSFQSSTVEAAEPGNTLRVINGGDSGSGTLRAALSAAADGDTVIFEGVTTVTLSSEILINKKNITINGVAGVTIKRSSAAVSDFRLFNSTVSDGTLTLKGLTLHNGDAAGNGGGLYAAGNVELVNCIFAGNTSAGSGGGIYAGGNVGLTACDLIKNTAGKAGGGIYAGGNVVLKGCAFTGNISKDNGGGIYAGGNIVLRDCGFAYNSSADGTIWSGTGNASADNCSFFDNRISGNDAGIVSAAFGAGLRHCTFTNNSCTGASAYNLYVRNGSTPAVENCLMTRDGLAGNSYPAFTGNNMLGTDSTGDYNAWFGNNILTFTYIMPLAGKVGNAAAVISGLDTDAGDNARTAAKCLYGAINLTAKSLMVTNSNDSGPGSLRESLGAAAPSPAPDRRVMYFDPAVNSFHIYVSSTLSVPNNGLVYGRLGGDGKPDITIDAQSKCGVLSGSMFSTTHYYGLNVDNGYSTSSNGGAGIGTTILGGSLVIKSCTFTNNKTSYSGGAVCIMASGNLTLTLEKCTFVQSTADYSGGAVYGPLGSMTLKWCVFIDNRSHADGGAVCFNTVFTASVNAVTDCVFINNMTTSGSWGGGAVFLTGPSLSSVTGCMFVGNSSGGIVRGESGGGAVYGYGTEIALADCIFIDNSAPEGNGGAVYAGSGSATNCMFIGNSATGTDPRDGFGGGVYFKGGGVLDCCVFADNEAENGAGAIHANSIYATNCTISRNTTGGASGAVESALGSHLFHVTVTENKGGGVYAGGVGDKKYFVYLYNSIVSGNTGTDGATPLQTTGNAVNVSSLIEGQNGVTHTGIFGPNTFNPLTGAHNVLWNGTAACTAVPITAADLSALTPAQQHAVLSALEKDWRGTLRGDPVTYGAVEAEAAAVTVSIKLDIEPAGCSVYGETVTITAALSVEPDTLDLEGKPIIFRQDGNMIGTALCDKNGVAVIRTDSLPVGTLMISAEFEGDSELDGCSDELPYTVKKADTVTSIVSGSNPSNLGKEIAFIVTVAAALPGTGTPTGMVDLFIDGAWFGTGTLNSSGTTAFRVSGLSLGAHQIEAYYLGDGRYNVSDDRLEQKVVNNVHTPPQSDKYYIFAIDDAHSTVSPAGKVAVQKGDDKTFLFSADEGYTISAVLVDGSPLSLAEIDKGSFTFEHVTADHTIEVRSYDSKALHTEEKEDGGDDGFPWWVLVLILLGILLLFIIWYRRYYDVYMQEASHIVGRERARRKKAYRFVLEEGCTGAVAYRIKEDGLWKQAFPDEDGKYTIPKDEVIGDIYLEDHP